MNLSQLETRFGAGSKVSNDMGLRLKLDLFNLYIGPGVVEQITKIYSQVIQACFIPMEESSVTVTHLLVVAE